MIADETDIEILPDDPLELEGETAIEAKPKKRFGPVALIGTAFLSSLLGAGVMLGTNTYLSNPAPDMAPTQAKLISLTDETQSLKAEAKTLRAQIARLQRDIKAKPAARPAIDLKPLEARLAALEDTQANISAAPIDEEMLARLEALQSEGSEALDLTDILTRLTVLENRPVDNNPDESADILARLDALEIKASSLAAMPIVTEKTMQDISILPAFPEDKIRAAIRKAQAGQGWLKKSLKKHISVQSDDNPTFLLETILTALEAGETKKALTAFDKLPDDVKAAGQNWRETMESFK